MFFKKKKHKKSKQHGCSVKIKNKSSTFGLSQNLMSEFNQHLINRKHAKILLISK